MGCVLIALFESCTGCKEIGPSVNLTPENKGNYDSVYTLTPSQIAALTADPHNVLVEEFTGQNCNNCPSAHSSLEAIADKYPGRINIVGLYLFGIPQANPPGGYIYDFRDKDSIATKIGNSIYGGIGGIPSGGIDRLQGSTNVINTDRTLWGGTIDNQVKVTDSVNLTLKSSFDTATQTAKIVATVTFIQPVTSKQNLTIVITEDGMIDKQEFPDGVHEGYKFTNVFRDMVSSAPSGDPVIDTAAIKTKGMVLQRTLNYKLKTTTPAIVPANCHVIAFISGTSGANMRVLQSVQTKMAP